MAAQPPGYPDVIRFVPEPSVRSAATAVLDGHIDLAYVDPIPLGLLTPAQRARQFHSASTVGTEFVMLNARRAPFDNVVARRAAAYAFTSDPAVGPILGDRPACTLAPVNYPGHTAGCAYVRNLTTARNLVRSSGTAGERVTVYSANGQPWADLGRETRNLLRAIGYHAELHVVRNYPRYADTAQRPVNVALMNWAPDFFAASQFYEPLFACRTGLYARLLGCNRAIDNLANRALHLQLTAPSSAEQLWERVYQRVDMDARVLPRGQVAGLPALLSTRTGDYTAFAPDYDTPLLDQLWVK
jgi:peptide/nickel transport system substrate-binding protein